MKMLYVLNDLPGGGEMCFSFSPPGEDEEADDGEAGAGHDADDQREGVDLAGQVELRLDSLQQLVDSGRQRRRPRHSEGPSDVVARPHENHDLFSRSSQTSVSRRKPPGTVCIEGISLEIENREGMGEDAHKWDFFRTGWGKADLCKEINGRQGENGWDGWLEEEAGLISASGARVPVTMNHRGSESPEE